MATPPRYAAPKAALRRCRQREHRPRRPPPRRVHRCLPQRPCRRTPPAPAGVEKPLRPPAQLFVK
jgi:hypothetical protein